MSHSKGIRSVDTDADKAIRTYINEHSVRQHLAQTRLLQVTWDAPEVGNFLISDPDQIQLLQNLAILIGAKKTLDIGVCTGYSTMSLALVLPSDGKVVACDVSERFTSIGKPVWKEAGVDSKIDLRINPAMDTLNSLIDGREAGSFDMAYIDANKTDYDNYYEMCLKLVRSGGIIVIDNVLWSGKVLTESTDPDTRAIQELNKKIAKDDRVRVSMLRMGDGTTLVFKK